nr:polyketide synthase [Thermoanaerobaculia bacterium]
VVRYLTEGPAASEAAPAAGPRGLEAGEEIAIVGLACRFPGGADARQYWQSLVAGKDSVIEVPESRFSLARHYHPDVSVPGKMSTRWSGLLDDVRGFDAAFFGISPREAKEMDPQQRLVMELAWEAFEDAGITPAELRSSRTGVFMGSMWSDYARLTEGRPESITQYTATGTDISIASARVNYFFGLAGPALTVNTACSSSLVAIHLACQSLRSGDSQLALAGGVSLIVSPASTISMSKFGAMAPDGRSKAFDARANGYVRGEGAGVVVLKPLSAALADGDFLYCVIKAAGINNDGYSNGLTAPNPEAQAAMLREAYARAGVGHNDVHYVETHGTGTMLGDPIEAGALGSVLGRGRPSDRPLKIGSVKTNIGHLEAAAGMAGLIKTCLAMCHRTLPPTLHFQSPNP